MDITLGHVIVSVLIIMGLRSLMKPVSDTAAEAKELREVGEKILQERLGEVAVETIVEDEVATSPPCEDEENEDDLVLVNQRIVRGIRNTFRVSDIDDDEKIYFARIDMSGRLIGKFRSAPSDHENVLLKS